MGRPYLASTGRDMENYHDQLDECYGPMTNSFDYYREFVDNLRDMDSLRVVPLGKLQTTSVSDQRLLSLRHDIDSNIETALRAARYLSRVGIAGSFYLLHTAAYYGEFLERAFVRNPLLPEWIRGFIVSGCELGLHNDAWGGQMQQGINGAAAVCEEIAWLRSQGANICGTVGHNSAPTYGAENCEIFREHVLWARKVVTPSGTPLAIGALSELELGLTYEGSFATKKKSLDPSAIARFLEDRGGGGVRSESWMRQYLLENPCLDWRVDFQFWLVSKNSWAVAGHWEGETVFHWDIGLDEVLTCIRELPDSSRSVAVIHPCYVCGE